MVVVVERCVNFEKYEKFQKFVSSKIKNIKNLTKNPKVEKLMTKQDLELRLRLGE